MPAPVFAAVSDAAHEMPAAPRSCTPTARPASSSSRHASMSRFSSKGSPTCTDGRLASSPSAKPADASTLAPPMPSRPVAEPSSTARLPTPSACAEHEPVDGQHAEAQHVDERVVAVALVEHDLAADRRHADRVAVAADARRRRPRRGSGCAASSSGPKRSGSISAIGRAPIEKMSRMIPPTPVAAPWYGSTADGWLWLSMRIATARPSPTSITPAPSPGPTSTHGASVGKRPR